MVPQEVEQGWFSKLIKGKNDSIPPAAKAGLTEGDKIVGINGESITYYHEYLTVAEANKGKDVLMAIQRGGKADTLDVSIGADGKTGFFARTLTIRQDTTVYFNFGESIVKGTTDAFGVITANIKAFGKIFKGDVAFSNAISGPVGIAKMFGGYWDWGRFWKLTGMLSMVLAFMNLLPIPALDGGHAVLLIYEMVSGRKPSEKFVERTQQLGMLIILALMVFVFYNDLR
jgi:regulator of sigma E protease